MSKKKHRSIFDKLTDTSLYTGAHKSRFDSDGKGRGLAGRDSPAVGKGSLPSWHGDRDKKVKKVVKKKKIKKKVKKTSSGDSSDTTKKVTTKKVKKVKKTSSLDSSDPAKKVEKRSSVDGTKKKVVKKKKKVKRKKKRSIYDKLTDTSLYTGSHKARFNPDGSGRGKAGRDLGSLGSGNAPSAPW